MLAPAGRRRLLAVAFVLAFARAAPAAMPLVRHQARAAAPRGAAVPIEVRLEPRVEDAAAAQVPGTPSPPPAEGYSVTLEVRPSGARETSRHELAESVPGVFRGEIPATATAGIAVGYVLHVRGPGGEVTDFGSLDQPITVDLIEAAPRPLPVAAIGGGLAVVLAVVGAIAAVLVLGERRRRQALELRRFWTRTLFPLLGLRERALADALNNMSRIPLNLPGGARTVSRTELTQRLSELRQVVAVTDRTFWLETLSSMLSLSGRPLASEVAKLSCKGVEHPVSGPRAVGQAALLHRLEDVRALNVAQLVRDRNRTLVPGFDDAFLREARHAEARRAMSASG